MDRPQCEARRARFAREAANPPPAPVRTMAWAGGKMTSNTEAALRKFVARKGDELSPEQLDAVAAARVVAAATKRPTVLRSSGDNVQRSAAQPAPPAKPSDAGKADAKLRKKIAEICALEQLALSGAPLEANQRAKLVRKQELLAQLGA